MTALVEHFSDIFLTNLICQKNIIDLFCSGVAYCSGGIKPCTCTFAAVFLNAYLLREFSE